MADTSIEWTDAVWNPTTGCDRVSPGCDNCYALTMARRLKGMGSAKYQTDGDPRTSGPGFGLATHDDVLEVPLRWRKPRKVFVNSMSDLFHPKVTDEFIAEVFGVMMAAPQHTFQVLTKRTKRMRALMNSGDFDAAVAGAWERHAPPSRRSGLLSPPFPSPNVWLGTSVEDQQRADERIPALIDTPAAVRFLSMEPLLGPVTLRPEWIELELQAFGANGATCFPRVDWLIVGGESGPGARPMHPQWARDLRDQCVAAGVPLHFKQWGAWVDVDQAPDDTVREIDAAHNLAGNPQRLWHVGKHAAGRELDGRTWDQFPEAVSADA